MKAGIPMDQLLIPLSKLNSNTQGRIVNISGGHMFQQRLRSMGIRNGNIIKVKTRQPFRGPVTIEVCGTQMTIGRGMAHKIQVELIE